MGCSQSAAKPVQRPADAALPVKTDMAQQPQNNATGQAEASAPSAAAGAPASSPTNPTAAVAASAAAATVPASGPTTDAAHAKAALTANTSLATAGINLTEAEQHRPLIVCGPSGVGKGTLLTRLLSEYPSSFALSVSHTTRAPRQGEVNGVSYHFTDVDSMLAQVADGKFIEHANVHGNYYGTSIASVTTVMQSGRLCLLEIDIQGVLAVRKVESLKPRCIFVRPPTFADLAQRLEARGSESAATTQKRLDTAREEMDFFYTHRHIFDADLINEDLEASYQQLIALIRKMYPTLKLEKVEKAPAATTA